ncbi:MAG: hypothetical protein QM784_09765 [Polyangiaceae bacterium]
MTIRYIHIEDAMPRGDVMRVMGALYDHGRQLTDVGCLVKEFQLSTSDGVEDNPSNRDGDPFERRTKPPCLRTSSRSWREGSTRWRAFSRVRKISNRDDEITDVTNRQDK